MSSFVSIIIPAFNAESSIKKCLNTVINQTHKNIEIIVINDGSEDRTRSIVESIMACDSRIKLINKSNQGVSKARNEGLIAARGDYICFLDSDDYYKPNYIEKMVRTINKKDNYDIVALALETIKESDVIKYESLSNHEAIDYLCRMKMPTSVWAYMYKKSIIKGLFFDPTILFFEDFLFNYIALFRANSIAIVKEKLYSYEQNANSVNSKNDVAVKLTALEIPFRLLKVNNLYKSKYIYEAYSYFIYSSVLAIAKSENDCSNYYPAIKEMSKEYVSKVKTSQISKRLYMIIAIASVSPRILVKLIKLVYQIRQS